ncbi:MAG: pitrilysin family protein [Gemmatimonadaceae bacterium]
MIRMSLRFRALVVPGAVAILSNVVSAQAPGKIDRTKQPPIAPAPVFKAPSWTVDTLSNGVRLVVVEKHDLPLVSMSLHFEGGSNQLGSKRGVAGFVASMLREGTSKRSADQLNNDLALLGTSVAFGIGSENGSAGFSTLTRTFDSTMSIMMDMMLNSTFPAPSLERLRTQALAGYTRSQDVSGTIAAQVAAPLIYADQPYGAVVNDADLKAVTRDDVADLAKKFFVPVNATAYVVGDMTRAQAKAKLEKAFAGWTGGQKVVVKYPDAPVIGSTTIYVVDMPNKPQSTLMLARTIAPEYSADMAKVDVMNAILGGMFQSRLNSNIREAKGYSYGFNSGVGWRKGPGTLRAQGDVIREKTDSSLIEAMKEIRGMSGDKPVTADELTAAKNSYTLSLPSDLQSIAGISGVVSRIVDNDLPKDWWSQYIASINATTAADVAAMSAKYMDPTHLVILIVGDKAKIMESLKATQVAPIIELDKKGKRIAPI